MEKTPEQRVAETLLQTPAEVIIGKSTYTVAPPTLATLIKMSEAISLLPAVKLDREHVVEDALGVARHCGVIADILAILILGAKAADEAVEPPRRLWWGIIPIGWQTPREKPKTRRQALAEDIANELTPLELHNTLAQLLARMQVADFFALTTFLTEINLTRPTKVVTSTSATAPGR